MTGEPPHASHPTRFRKGQSGNPKGRPHKVAQKPASAFQVVFDYTLPVKRGAQKAIPAEEAMLHKLLQQAMAGERLSQRKILQMIARHDTQRAPMAKGAAKTQMLALHWPPDVDESARLLGIARVDPHPLPIYSALLLIEPWAVQLGLERAGPLNEGDLVGIKNTTLHPDTVRWPAVSARDE